MTVVSQRSKTLVTQALASQLHPHTTRFYFYVEQYHWPLTPPLIKCQLYQGGKQRCHSDTTGFNDEFSPREKKAPHQAL